MKVDPFQVRRFLEEDLGEGDVTAQIIPATYSATAMVITRETMVVCGQDWFAAIFQLLDSRCQVAWEADEGQKVPEGALLCRVTGPARALLSGERTALNLLQTLSGTATLARLFADEVAGTQAVVLDTRKTIPGLRQLQKYAVRVGGCQNHRFGLYDGILIKENHILAAGSIDEAIARARALNTGLPIEVEVENLEEMDQALAAGADIILLDNFSLPELVQAVRRNAGRALLEASGDIGLENIREVAETGVDRISVGAMTKHLRAVDLSMRIELMG
ncbi:MAG: nicotinate-nucleotide pyrophosphorylase [Methylothermaceae bacteria B42]|nr:MAG: nicotinate-nucleotide pyrophosphorylase [Methylothermaceae bacteria B42]HHJ39623.1 carboxylating nicotinate-nucleotide diphosphorylase [Methylothermaceae bacterium]